MLTRRYKSEIEYISSYWDRITFHGLPRLSGWRNLIMRIGYIKLPNKVVSPNHEYFAGTQFYWDSYFHVIGLCDEGRYETAKGLVDNQLNLFDRYGIILARNSLTSLGRTQPPFLTSELKELEKHGESDAKWLADAYQIAEREYHQVWCTKPRYDASTGMSRYHPKLLPKIFNRFESGWDLSSRFDSLNNDVIPVDLNCLLYKYESDLEKHAINRGEVGRAKYWRKRQEKRKKAIDKYFWDEEAGYFYDFHPGASKDKKLITLAGIFPLWCGAASEKQAKRCVEVLHSLEYDGGLSSSEKLNYRGRQWDYPNGWANLQLIAIEGLLNYGYEDDARRIADKWLELNSRILKDTGKFWEKYDVVNGGIGLPGRYPTQSGFGWTNAVFTRLCRMFDEK